MGTERQKQQTKPDEAHPPEQTKDKRAEYLTARQLSEVLQISEATVHRLRRSGRIPAVLLTDRLIRFNLREVQKALRPRVQSTDGSEVDRAHADDPQLSFEDLLAGADDGRLDSGE